MSRKTTIISIVSTLAAFIALVVLLVMFGRPPLKIRGGGGSYVGTVGSQNEVTSARRVDEKAGEVLGGAPISKCQELAAGNEADECVWSVALTKEEIVLCDSITDETLQTRCRGVLMARSAVNAEDPSLCILIADEASRRTCLRNTIVEKTPASLCETFAGEDKVVCDDSRAAARVRAGDTAICETIVDQELQGACLGVARRKPPADIDRDSLTDTDEIERYKTDPTKKDTDSDGLTDGEEVNKWKTDPTKADTDGDGFSDKTEIDGGYNPLGSGRL